MSIECGECERDMRGPHGEGCSRATPDLAAVRSEALEEAAKIADGEAIKREKLSKTHHDHTARYHNDCRELEARSIATAIRALSTTPATSRLAGLEARCASAEIALSEVEAERDEAADRAGALEAENARLRDALERIAQRDGKISSFQCQLKARAALNPEGES